MTNDKLRVAVVGAGRWAQRAHIPGWQRDPRVEVVALSDTDPDILAEAGRTFGVDRLVGDYRELLADDSIDVIDVATANQAHFEVSEAALRAGKHVLCEKPVHHDFHETQRLSDLARQQGLKTKLGFTFRYAPAVQYARHLIDAGFVGTPYIFNGYEQNSQWIDPQTPHAAGRPAGGPEHDRDLVHRGVRRADHRHHARLGRWPAGLGRRHDAQLRAQAGRGEHR